MQRMTEGWVFVISFISVAITQYLVPYSFLLLWLQEFLVRNISVRLTFEFLESLLAMAVSILPPCVRRLNALAY